MTLFTTAAALATLAPRLTLKAATAAARDMGITIRRDRDSASGYEVFPKGQGDSALFAEDAAESLFLAEVMADDMARNALSLSSPVTLRGLANVLARRAAAAFNLPAGAIGVTIEAGRACFRGMGKEYWTPVAGRLPIAEIAAQWAAAAEALAESYVATAAAQEAAKEDGITVEEAGPDWEDSGLGRFYAQRGAGAFAFGDSPAAALAALKAKEGAGPLAEVIRECDRMAAPRSLSAAATPVAFLDDSSPGHVSLYDESGAWIGPGLGDFPNATAARDWAQGRGFNVKPLLPREEVDATRAEAMRASLAALRACHASLDRRADSLGGLKAATLRARLRLVYGVARLKARDIAPEMAAAFALPAIPAAATLAPMPESF